MYSLLIVEDEDTIRTGLEQVMPWRQWGFYVLAAVGNGREAIKVVRAGPPDAVLSDIRMPAMDGLALLDAVRALYPSLPFVLLSGYDDFEYVRRALALGAHSYVLKHEIHGDLSRVMASVRETLDKQRAEQARLMQAQKVQFRNEVLRALVERRAPESAGQMDALAYCAVSIALTLPWQAKKTGGEAEPAAVILRAQAAVEALREEHLLYCLKENELLAVFYAPPERIAAVRAAVCAALQRFCDDIAGHLPQGMGAGVIVSGAFAGTAGLRRAWDQLTVHAPVPVSNTPCLFIDAERLPALHADMDVAQLRLAEHALIDSLELGDAAAAAQHLERWLSLWAGACISTFRRRCIWLLVSITRALPPVDGGAETPFDMEQIEGTGHPAHYMRGRLHALMQSGQTPAGNHPHTVSNLVQYIRTHCMQRLSLQALAGKLYMNPSYLSTRFKQETGMTFSQFYTGLRVEKAKELLRSGYKPAQVAELLHYEDAKSFIRMFKKHVGASPCISACTDAP